MASFCIIDKYEEGVGHSRNSSSSSVSTSPSERDIAAFNSWEGETVLDRARKLIGQLAEEGPLPVDGRGRLKMTLYVISDMRDTSEFRRLPRTEINIWDCVQQGLKELEAMEEPWAVALDWRRWTKGEVRLQDFWLLTKGSGVERPMDARIGNSVVFRIYNGLDRYQEE